MPPLRIVFPLAMFMILTSGASGQEVEDRYNSDKAMSREPSCNLNRQKWFVLLQAG